MRLPAPDLPPPGNPVPVAPWTGRHAVIDIGTNSVKGLVGDVRDAQVIPVDEWGLQTRLGRGFYEDHVLQPGPIQDTARTVADFADRARGLGACSIRVIATSAAREARNADDLLRAVREASGLATEIISGEQEADWGFAGVLSTPGFPDGPFWVLDVGGGSTEIMVGHPADVPARPRHRCSHPLGTVRLLSHWKLPQDPTPADLRAARAHVADFFAREILPTGPTHPLLSLACPDGDGVEPSVAFGIGGTTALLGRIQQRTDAFERDSLERIAFSRNELTALVELLWGLPLNQRQQLPGLPPERADVILAGAVIYEQAMAALGFERLRVSTRGLRFAVLMTSADSPALPAHDVHDA